MKHRLMYILDLGVDVKYNKELGKDFKLEELKKDYDAIFLATGANRSAKMGVEGENLKGFIPDWIGEFYAYYQWYYNMPSSEVIQKIPVDFLKKAYYGLHDLELDLAVRKVGEV